MRTQTVTVPGPWVFEPATAEVAAGVPVVFRNEGGAAHSVTFDGLGVDLVVPAGGEVAHTFTQAGTFAYVCKFHPPDMKGVVVVAEA